LCSNYLTTAAQLPDCGGIGVRFANRWPARARFNISRKLVFVMGSLSLLLRCSYWAFFQASYTNRSIIRRLTSFLLTSTNLTMSFIALIKFIALLLRDILFSLNRCVFVASALYAL
jgi:hypothetical protein